MLCSENKKNLSLPRSTAHRTDRLAPSHQTTFCSSSKVSRPLSRRQGMSRKLSSNPSLGHDRLALSLSRLCGRSGWSRPSHRFGRSRGVREGGNFPPCVVLTTTLLNPTTTVSISSWSIDRNTPPGSINSYIPRLTIIDNVIHQLRHREHLYENKRFERRARQDRRSSQGS